MHRPNEHSDPPPFRPCDNLECLRLFFEDA